MSREYCWVSQCYFYRAIEEAAQEHLESDKESTRMLGAFLKALEPVAYAVASYEESDSGPDYPIEMLIGLKRKLPELQNQLNDFLRPYERVMESAVRNYIKEQEKKIDFDT